MTRLLVAIAVSAVMVGCETDSRPFDVIIRGGTVFDGVTDQPQRVDVAIAGDRIVSIGDLSNATSRIDIDARDLTVAPGFIDVQARSGATLLADGNGESHLKQGVTTEILGDLDSPAFWTTEAAGFETLRGFGITFDWRGIEGYHERLLQRGIAVNVATLIPLNAAQQGSSSVEAAMKGGAIGVALTHRIASLPATARTLRDVAGLVARNAGVLTIHVPGTGSEFLRGIDEAIDLAAASTVPIVIYQPEATEMGDLGAAVERISSARARGVDVHTTMTPGAAGYDTARAYWWRDTGASVGSQTAAVQTEGLLGKDANSRAHDTFPHVFTRYVLEGQLSLGQAIKRITGTAAAQFALEDRGTIRAGGFADVVVFAPQSVAGQTTGRERPSGSMRMQHVIVNGVPVVAPQGLTGARPGRVVTGRARAVVARPVS